MSAPHHHPHPHHHDHRRREIDLATLKASLRKGTRKITGQRLAILEILQRHPHPMTNKQIHAALPKQTCDLATIYRSMQMLEAMGIVKRYDFGDGTARFEIACHEEGCHHHHLVCTQCDTVVELEECFPERLEKKVAREHGFAQVTHKLEFFGLCPKCQR